MELLLSIFSAFGNWFLWESNSTSVYCFCVITLPFVERGMRYIHLQSNDYVYVSLLSSNYEYHNVRKYTCYTQPLLSYTP